jgi:hypothetical protein
VDAAPCGTSKAASAAVCRACVTARMRQTVPVALVALCCGVYIGCERPRELPGIETDPVCESVAKTREPDIVFASTPDAVRASPSVDVSFGELRSFGNQRVRVTGFLVVEFDHKALYPSREIAVAEWSDLRRPYRAIRGVWTILPNVFESGEPWWKTEGPAISYRCARVSGEFFRGPTVELPRFTFADGRIKVSRLEVWSEPYRPYDIPTRPPRPVDYEPSARPGA